MTWSPERAYYSALRLFAVGWLALAIAITRASAEQAAVRPTETAAAVALPAWMELSALATNAAAWADLADIWRRDISKRKLDAERLPNEDISLSMPQDGRGRVLLHAGKAVMGKDGLIWAWQVTMDLFDSGGAPDGRIEAASLLCDRAARRCYSSTAVTWVRTNSIFHGAGMYLDVPAQRLYVFSNTVTQLKQSMMRSAEADTTNGTLDRAEQKP